MDDLWCKGIIVGLAIFMGLTLHRLWRVYFGDDEDLL